MAHTSSMSQTCSRNVKIALIFVISGAVFAVQASAWRAPEVKASEGDSAAQKVVGAPADLVEAAKIIALAYDENGGFELPAWATADKSLNDRITAKRTLINNRRGAMGIEIVNLKRDVTVKSQKIDGNSSVITFVIFSTHSYRGDGTPAYGSGDSTVTLSKTENGGYRVDGIAHQDPYAMYIDAGWSADIRSGLSSEAYYAELINAELRNIAKEKLTTNPLTVTVETRANNFLDENK